MAALTTIGLGLLSGLAIRKIYKWVNDDDDAVSDSKMSDYGDTVSVANRLEELYGGTAFVGLRIPNPESRSLQNIDIVLVNDGKAVVISVKKFSGVVSINNDGSWLCMGEPVHPNPVVEVKKQASILESYLEQRGIPAGEGCLSYKVMLINPRVNPISLNIPEVITYEQLMHLKPEHPKLNLILGTAPMWDRLRLDGNKFVLGEFLKFRGWQEDLEVLRCIERSNVSRLIIQKGTLSTLIVQYCDRNFQELGALASEWKKLALAFEWKQLFSAPEWKKLTVGSNVEVLFRPEDSTKVHKFKLSSIVTLELSA